jgi:hypothetical protein
LLRIHPRQLIVHLHAFDTATAKRMATAFSSDANGRLCIDATPRQTNHQRLQLLLADRNATAAIDTPGWRQADTTFALNSALCVRRRRRTMTSSSEVSMCPPKI